MASVLLVLSLVSCVLVTMANADVIDQMTKIYCSGDSGNIGKAMGCFSDIPPAANSELQKCMQRAAGTSDMAEVIAVMCDEGSDFVPQFKECFHAQVKLLETKLPAGEFAVLTKAIDCMLAIQA